MQNKNIKIFSLIVLKLIPLMLLAQTGPGGIGMSDGTSALKLWLDAGREVFSDTVTARPARGEESVLLWKDLSGNNNHVKARTDSTLPTLSTASNLLNQQNGIRFYQSGSYPHKRTFLSSPYFSATSDITIYCVFHALTKGGGNNVTPYKATDYDVNMWYYGAGLVDAGTQEFTNDISLAFCDTSIAAGSGDSTTATDYCVKTPASVNKTYFAVLQKEALSGQLSVAHNKSAASVYQAGMQPINDASGIFIGSNSNFTSPYETPFFDGYIANVLIYNKILTSAEKIILENYLSAKYNLRLKDNDIYKFDDASSGNYDHDVAGIGKAMDGSFHLNSRGEGIVELSSALELQRGEFIFTGHDGKSVKASFSDLAGDIQFRLERKWIYSANGNTRNVDLIVDSEELPIDRQNIALLIDTDNDGSFANEKIGGGIIFPSEITSLNRYVFRGVGLRNGNTYTFAQLKPACTSDCEAFFSPDGDGVADVYYLKDSGKTSIFDRSGKLIRSLVTPAYWDGTDAGGNLSVPGIYFLVADDESTRTVTLIR
jgi:hypothetical protein